MMKGYTLIEYSRDENYYNTYFTKKDAEKAFIKAAKNIGKTDPEILANNQDDMEELAAGGIYSPNGELALEIVPCDIDTDGYDRQKRIETAFCNVGEPDWPEDVIAFLEEDPEDYGYLRNHQNSDSDKKVIVWEPYQDYTNEGLVNYIKTGSFN